MRKSSKTKQAPQPEPNQSTVQDELEEEIKQLEIQRKEAEERRRLEDEALQEKIKEIERKKKEEEERQRLEEERRRREEEERERQRLLAEEERKRKEEEDKRRKFEEERERKEAEERRLESERRRKRLEQMRRNEEQVENDSTEELISRSDISSESELEKSEKEISKCLETENIEDQQSETISQETEPRLQSSGVEPDIVASIKERPSDLGITEVASPESQPPPVAPPRRRKKKKPTPEVGAGDASSANVETKEQQAQQQEQEQQPQEPPKPIEPVGLPVSDRSLSEVLTPTTTIESITKELEHSLDLASAIKGDNVVQHEDLEQIKGKSKADLEGRSAVGNTSSAGETVSDGKTDVDTHKEETQDTVVRGDDDDENVSQRLIMTGRTKSGKILSDEEVLSQVMVKNLDTGEKISLAEAEDKLPKCINPLALHIMRITSEYVSNSSLHKDTYSDEEMEEKQGLAATQEKVRQTTFKLKKIIGKTVNKTVSKIKEVTKHEESSSSDDEAMPMDNRLIKIKACSHNKGPYDFDQVKMAQDLSGDHVGAVWTMKFSYCGRLLATAGQDTILRIWVLKDHYSYFDDMRQKYNSESRVSPSPSQESINSITSEREVEQAAIMDDDEAAVFARRPFCTYAGHTGDVLDVSWSKNYFILSSSMDKTVRLWHISRRECLCCFQHIDFVTAIAFHPRDDRYFLSGSLDGKLRLWNIPDKKVALWNEVDGQTKLITAANFCQHGRFAVVGTYDGRCVFYDTEHLKYFTQIHVRSTRGKNAKGRKITGIEPLPGQDKILITSNDSRIRLYDLRDLSLACKYKGCANNSSQIKASLSHNCKYIICGSEDRCMYIWKTHHDFTKFTSVRRDRNDYWESIKAHTAVVTAAVFATNPSLIIKPKDDNEADKKSDEPLAAEAAAPVLTAAPKKSEKLPKKGEVFVSADFNGVMKVFISYPKQKSH
ncbi:WD repeat-containing protein 44-like isoform X2 [Ptychodera flava]|uniref:WD repeat-containing protein 44-like isoform X2 n=1 Tax=Ptychodera flava TaxID=63121 RepID=UPI00396A7278